MGSCLSSSSDAPTTTAMAAATPEQPPPPVQVSADTTVEVTLKKNRPGCTGMFWREDPTRQKRLRGNQNWPRDNAKLRGTVVECKGQKWLLATHVQQAGSNKWVEAPPGAAMPFAYQQYYLK
jgi:hypothetical protein